MISILKKQISELINIYQREIEKYRKILDLTKQEKKLINKEEYKKLNSLLEQKNDFISTINKLEKEVLNLKSDLSLKLGIKNDDKFIINLLKRDNLPQKDQLKKTIKSMHMIMNEIEELMSKHKNKMGIKKREMTKDINKIKKGLDLNNSYSGHIKNYEGKYFDQKK